MYFDDLRITHTKSKILQEDHYYPFGLSISALSSTGPLSKPNQFKYNGKELNEEFDLNWYDYGARNYDAQLGRWFNVDPLAYVYLEQSPYHYSYNNPLNFRDPDGRKIVDANGNEVAVDIEEDEDGNRVASYTFAEGTSKKVMRKFKNNAGRVISQAVQTEKGLEKIYDALDSGDNISIEISSSTASTGGALQLGSTRATKVKTDGDGNRTMDIMVTIYNGSIKDLSGLDPNNYPDLDSKSKETRKLWNENYLTSEQKIGAVGVYEISHATQGTDKKAMATGRPLSNADHQKAYENEAIHIKSLNKSKKK
ncbi:RHS repeat-associated core domain-containing protein [Roseivirga thermotolerans]|uniref:RHS repeat-associated core domain-containing protein n=1 Tax=Roseivirga thermotolerans TaxID=1758176 RepID=UPI00273D2BF3|nr:RHS repeat-associated core domain-containing protein [Roseivirga thermotolerans]